MFVLIYTLSSVFVDSFYVLTEWLSVMTKCWIDVAALTFTRACRHLFVSLHAATVSSVCAC